MRLDIYDNPSRKDILDAIGLEEDKIPRIRGVGIDGGKILIHTRTGGGNRESYDNAEAFIEGDYGLDNSIKDCREALKDFENWRWHISVVDQYDVDYDWRLPYEARFRYPETDEEWDSKEKEILSNIKGLEKQKAEVLKTSAYTNDYMRNNPYFISDNDEDFDSTYADWWFVIPQEHAEKLLPLEDPIRKAALGNSLDYIEAFVGGDKSAKERILKRIKSAKQTKQESRE